MPETGTTHIYCRNYRDFKITTTEEGGLAAAWMTYSRVCINSLMPQLHNEQEAVYPFGRFTSLSIGRFTSLSKRSSASYGNRRDEKGGVISDDKNTSGSSGVHCRYPTSQKLLYGPWRFRPNQPQLMVHPNQQEQQQMVLTILAHVGLVGWDCVTLKSMVLGRRR
jgi:hypothetical protein